MRRRSRLGRALAVRPIDSVKNMVSLDTTIATLSVVVVVLAKGIDPTFVSEIGAGLGFRVESGAKIRGFNIAYSLYNRSGGLPGQEKVGIMIRKNEGLVLPAPTLAQCNDPSSQPWKNKIFHYIQAKPSDPTGIGMHFGGIRIPKRFEATRISDQWELIIWNNGSGSVDGCGTCIYKWYR